MKLAIISDLHSLHWKRAGKWEELVDSIRDSLAVESPDIVLDAGDAECDIRRVLDVEQLDFLGVKGNHDWYYEDFDPGNRYLPNGNKRETVAMWTGSSLILGCTLWTDFNSADPATMSVVTHSLADYRLIRRFDAQACYDEHVADRNWLYDNRASADVVVTHHAPSFKSVHPRFVKPGQVENLINYGFVSELDDLVESMVTKLWVHGHVHDACDYMIGKTRVVANPCGYPHERRDPSTYKPLYIEL